MSKVSAEALAFRDEVAAPLTFRQIERALRAAGNSRTWSARIANELRNLNIIAIKLKENDDA